MTEEEQAVRSLERDRFKGTAVCDWKCGWKAQMTGDTEVEVVEFLEKVLKEHYMTSHEEPHQ